MTSKKSKQDALIDELLQDCNDSKDILGNNGLLKQLTKRLVERTLEAEFDQDFDNFLWFEDRQIPHSMQPLPSAFR